MFPSVVTLTIVMWREWKSGRDILLQGHFRGKAGAMLAASALPTRAISIKYNEKLTYLFSRDNVINRI